ncbi:MAG: ribonuclease R [Lachnospiraceae bacterium]|nr:ribonuclease R [Candidatus Colinaster equi]
MKKSREKRMQVILDLMNDEYYVPMKEKELAVILQVEPEDRPELSSILQELLLKQKIEISKRGKYQLLDPKNIKSQGLLTGTFISNAKGFGFVEVEGREEDLFIPQEYTFGAFHLDIVQAQILKGKSGHRTEAKIVKILERGTTQIVGTYQKSNKSFGFVVPDNTKLDSDIYIRVEDSKGAMDGHKVVVELLNYGDNRKSPEGKVIEILGHVNDPGVDIISIVKGFGLPMEFPEKVMNQAERIPDHIIEADMNGRSDLRDVLMVTIDGPDAKDLDDAVSLSMDGDNYVLGVHIADVSNYVQENSALDHEAIDRGTSVYLVDRVIPMLPHRLSNGICSLNAGEDRLALSCIMTINKMGKVIDHEIVESVINVNHRMDYPSVNRIIALKDEEERNKFADVVDMLDKMYELSSLIRNERRKRGSIDFDFAESKIILDENGHPTEIKPYERNAATKLIEDFMLMANETVAEHFYWLDRPFVYRTHETPDPEKIQKLAAFINNFGFHIHMAQEEIHPKEIQKLLGEVQETPYEDMIAMIALRSMKQAKYTTECTGHFGLACKYYCHFTSPIRRYPDLQIHRIIKDEIRGRMKNAKIEHYTKILPDIATGSSKKERRADEAERETDKLKKVQYMQDHLGEEYDGVISGITEWGLYVQLANTVEGLVHITRLTGDFFVYDEASYVMKGTKHGMRYEMGQRVRVRVLSTDDFMRTIDFELVPNETNDEVTDE